MLKGAGAMPDSEKDRAADDVVGKRQLLISHFPTSESIQCKEFMVFVQAARRYIGLRRISH